MLNSNENQNSSPEVLAAQTEGTATEATTAVLDDSTGQETSENDAGNISNDEVMSNNEDDRRVGFSSSTSSSKDLVNEQEGVTELKKGKGKRSASERLQRSKQQLKEKDEEIIALKAQQNTKYTATVGVGLAAGLIAFTALEHTVRLEMLVIIGIAVTSALVAGGITYAVLPSTQVDGAKEQEVNEMGKRSNKG